MKNLLVQIKKYKAETVLAPLFKMLEALFELFVPLVVKQIIDTGIADKNIPYILKMCALLAALALIGLAFSITAQFFAAKAAVGVATNLRRSLFGHIQSLSYTEIDRLGSSKLITRMTSDVNQVQNGVNLTLRLLLRSPFVVFGAMIMAFTVDTKSALVFVGTIPVLSVVVFGIMLITMPLYKSVQKKLDAVLSATRQSLTGSRVLRAFCQEEKEIDEFTRKNSLLANAQLVAGRISALLNPITFVLINTAIIILIYTGALRVRSGILTQGAVVALYNYMSQILVELIKLANLIISITKAVSSAKRIQDVFDTSSSMEYPENTAKADFNAPALSFSNVSMQYATSKESSLSNISLEVAKGEKIGIIGSTGSGKTTLINLIPRFYDVSAGEITLFGNPIKEYTKEELSSLVSVVPQRAALFSGSIRENLLWGNKNAGEEDIQRAIEISQSTSVINSKANGLDEIIEQGGRNLSGGQKQRLTIARALLKNAPILILDDSSSALDAATDLALRKAINTMENSPTVFIVSQRTSAVSSCDKILVLEDGEAVGIGTHDELLKTNEVYREIHMSLTQGGASDGK